MSDESKPAKPAKPMPAEVRLNLQNAAHDATFYLRQWLDYVRDAAADYPTQVPVAPFHLRSCDHLLADLNRITKSL